MEAKKISDSETVMTELVQPTDTNYLNNLMGGKLMHYMDIAAAICAGKHAEQPVVTASVDYLSFRLPIPLGDVITIKAVVTRAFSTSLEIYVEVFAANVKGGNNRRCNDAYFTFVALDETTRKPVPVAPVLPLTGEEINRYEGAARRREMRLVLSGRMKPEDAKEIKSLFS